MEKILKITIAAVIIGAFFYILGAFYHATFNISYWTRDVKGGLVYVYIVFMVFFFALSNIDD